MKKGKKRLVTMKIDEELYLKSKAIIPDRTKDYVNYLKRRISTNRAELLKKEIDDLDTKREALMREYDRELELQETTEHRPLKDLVTTVEKIINHRGFIGENEIENLAYMNGYEFAELKAAIPPELHKKFVKFYEPEEGTIYNELGGF